MQGGSYDKNFCIIQKTFDRASKLADFKGDQFSGELILESFTGCLF